MKLVTPPAALPAGYATAKAWQGARFGSLFLAFGHTPPVGLIHSEISFLQADFVVAGIGVRPRLSLAEQSGLTMDRGVLVNEYLQTSVPDVFAAGDIARWPDPHSKASIRVEHWVVAERQGQTAARNMLNQHRKFDAVPFFWSLHYDISVKYIGHAEQWDELAIEGNIEARDCLLRYRRNGRTLAVASMFRDLQNLEIEARMESAVAAR